MTLTQFISDLYHGYVFQEDLLMGNRFNVRSKCLAWPNVRFEGGNGESTGVTHHLSYGPIPEDIRCPDEGREGDRNEYRRDNESNYIGREPEDCWDNRWGKLEFMRKYDQLSGNEAHLNQPFRDYIFDDWETVKLLPPTPEYND